MKHLLFICWLLSLPYDARPSQDYVAQFGNESVVVLKYIYAGGDSDFSLAIALFFYLDLFNKKYFNDTARMKVVLNMPQRYYGSGLLSKQPEYLLSYGDSYFYYDEYEYPDCYRRDKAVTLYCHTETISLKKILKLLRYALDNLDDMASGEKLLIESEIFQGFDKSSESKGLEEHAGLPGAYYFLNALSQSNIYKILSSADTCSYEDILGRSFNPDWVDLGVRDTLGDYFMNDSCYVYERSNAIKKYKKISEASVKRHFMTDNNGAYGRTVGVFKERPIIISDENYYFLLTNDTTAYYYNFLSKEFTGPFVIPLASPEPEYAGRYFTGISISGLPGADTVILHCRTGSHHYYSVYFDTKNYVMHVDTTSFNEKLVADITELRAQRQIQFNIIKEGRDKQRNIIFLSIIVLLLNSFLALSKRL